LLQLRRRLSQGALNQGDANHKKVKLALEDGTLYSLEGALQFRDITVDPATASVILRVVFPNPDGILLPGMFVRASVQEAVNESAILIPQQTVARDPRGNPVTFVVDAGQKAQQRMLTLDRAIGDQWLVTSGLEPGDRVIVEGVQKVRPGAVVKAVPMAEHAPTDSAGSGDDAPAAAAKN
jgi:membrane fusion protein (multidrug efflux system)